jgi:hypothetical protein
MVSTAARLYSFTFTYTPYRIDGTNQSQLPIPNITQSSPQMIKVDGRFRWSWPPVRHSAGGIARLSDIGEDVAFAHGGDVSNL